MYVLENVLRTYAWGSTALIQRLLGAPVDGQPLAEVWMGAHPGASSVAIGGGRSIPLDVLIAQDPGAMLGARVAAATGGALPFLAKLLAAARPLSIQVHPTWAQAREGYDDEQERGIASHSPGRNYRDASHKPEIVYALTRFDLLSGLREPEQSAKLIEELGVADLAPLTALLRGSSATRAHRAALGWILDQRGIADSWVAEVGEAAGSAIGGRPESEVIRTLGLEFPHDPGLLAPLLLNYVRLNPGQAIFTGAGTLHAYLRGLAVEVMASSDNVIRAGLTSKHVDVVELMHVADFAPSLPGAIAPRRSGEGAISFVPPVDDFRVSVLTTRGGQVVGGPAEGPRILVAVEGVIEVHAGGTQAVEAGASVFVPHCDGPLSVSGSGTAVVAHT